VVAVVLLAIAALKPADAGVQCQGNFQITKYGPVATPYCEEEQIAIVAQSHGWHVSALLAMRRASSVSTLAIWASFGLSRQ
jgi:hypothetical protein